ncbi:MAG: DUF433 domain-containing protein [Pirellulales bacterium]|nr:DUF433 domain-containing protein [Pirellulales bacterium]
MPTETPPHSRLGSGLYSIPDAARIVREPIDRVRRWVNPEEQLIRRSLGSEERTITFLELMELHFISIFRSEGVTLQTIRKAAIAASRRFGTDYPFAVRRFDTDGRTIFATLIKDEEDEEVVEDLRRGQYVFRQIMRPFFRRLEYRDANEALRYWPLGTRGRVVLDPERHFGKPIDSETGIPTKTLYEAVKIGQDPPDVAKWFDVPRRAVVAAIRFESSLTA